MLRCIAQAHVSYLLASFLDPLIWLLMEPRLITIMQHAVMARWLLFTPILLNYSISQYLLRHWARQAGRQQRRQTLLGICQLSSALSINTELSLIFK